MKFCSKSSLFGSAVKATFVSAILAMQPAIASADGAHSTAIGDMSVTLYAADVAKIARELIDATPESQRTKLNLGFDDAARFTGTDTSQTPTFCKVLEWCPQGWGIEVCEMNTVQRHTLHRLLNRALSGGGYTTVVTAMNRNRIYGEMAAVSDTGLVAKIREEHPDLTGAASIFALGEMAGIDVADKYPTIGGARTQSGEDIIDWSWEDIADLETRYQQSCSYAFSIFGNPEDEKWSLRFEGHHLTVNLTFLSDDEGGMQVFSTPLFIGAFPMVIPEDPFDPEEIDTQWRWTQGQVLMTALVHHLRQFWLHVPEDLRSQAQIRQESFKQHGPMVMDTPTSSLVAALGTSVDGDVIEQYPHIDVAVSELSVEALWNLRQAYSFYFQIMNPNLEAHYADRFDDALDGEGGLTLAWSGDDLTQLGSDHYSYLVVDDLLLEVLQSGQFTIQHDPNFSGNHVHSMLRDLRFDWEDPMATHHHDHH